MRSTASAQETGAMLEQMQEKQVTVGNKTYPLVNPSLFLPHRNPIEMEVHIHFLKRNWTGSFSKY